MHIASVAVEGGKQGISLMEYKSREEAQKAAGSVVHVLIFLYFPQKRQKEKNELFVQIPSSLIQ